MNRIHPRYFPRTLGIYFDTCRVASYRMQYPFRDLATQGYPVGWAQSVHGVNLDAYDLVIFLRTPHTDDELLQEQVAIAHRAGKVILLDNAAPGFPEGVYHGVTLPDGSYSTGGNAHCIVDTGIDPQSWAATERWTTQTTIGLFSDTPSPEVDWRPLLPSLRGIRIDFPDVKLAVGYGAIPLLDEVATDTWQWPLLVNEHAATMGSVDILLCYGAPIRSHDVYEAANWGGIVIADPSYAHIVRSKGTLAKPDELYDVVKYLLHNPAKRKIKQQALIKYVGARKTMQQTIPHIVRAWQELYTAKIGSMTEARTG